MNKWFERLRELRVSKRYTQKDFANLLNINATAYNRYEVGRGPSTLPSSLKVALLDLLTKEEVDYIELGTELKETTPKISNEDEQLCQLIRDYASPKFKEKIKNRLEKIKKDDELF